MIDYKTYADLIEKVDKLNPEELKEYLAREREKYYLSKARRGMRDYIEKSHNWVTIGYLSSLPKKYQADFPEKVLVENRYSAFLFNADELVSNNYKKSLLYTSDKALLFICDYFCKLESQKLVRVGEIETTDGKYGGKPVIRLTDEENTSCDIAKGLFDYAEKLLGDDVTYELSHEEEPKCVVRSRKGRGMILPLKR